MKNTFISKTDLAQAYFPYVDAATARHKLMDVINADKQLMQSLLNQGYQKTSKQLSPFCVELITARLGNPWK